MPEGAVGTPVIPLMRTCKSPFQVEDGGGHEQGVNTSSSLRYPQRYFQASSKFSYLLFLGYGPLYTKTLATNASHYNGVIGPDVHNLWGFMEEKAAYLAFQATGQTPLLNKPLYLCIRRQMDRALGMS